MSLVPDPTAAAESAQALAELNRWLAGRRAEAAGEAAHHGALFASARDALANAAGVNLDDEMARLLEVERSYEATARLIATVDRLFDALLGAVR